MVVKGKLGGGGSTPASIAGTVTLTASTAAYLTVPLPYTGYLTGLVLRVNGDVGAGLTGGPAYCVAWLKRGPSGTTKLLEGVVNGASWKQCQGHGKISSPQGGDIIIYYDNTTATDIILAVDAWMDQDETIEPSELWMDVSAIGPIWGQVAPKTGATANPAAGSNPATLTVPAGKRWKLCAIYNRNVTSADVANRVFTLTITDGTNTVFVATQANQTASLNYGYAGSIGLPYLAVTTNGNGQIALPDIELGAGYTVAVSYTNLQAADDATALIYAYKELPA